MNLGNYIRFDWAMKRLLRNKADFEILEGFLSELLKDDIKIEEVLESEGNQENQEDKYNRVDILVKNNKNEFFIIEVQNELEHDYFQRMIYGTSKVITENIKLGEKYHIIKKVFSISIVYFDLGQGKDYVYRGTTDFVGIHNHDKLLLSAKQQKLFRKQEPRQIFPEYYIIKVNQFNNIAKDTLDEWIYFLKNTEIKDDFSAKGLAKAKELLQVDKMTKAEQIKYTHHLENVSYAASMAWTREKEIEFKLQARENKGIEQGREEERKIQEEKLTQERKIQEEKRLQDKKDIVINLLENNVSMEVIVSSTGLSVEEIEKIRGSMG